MVQDQLRDVEQASHKCIRVKKHQDWMCLANERQWKSLCRVFQLAWLE